MEKIILKVTKEDLKSEYNDPDNCAVARAVKRLFKNNNLSVGGSIVTKKDTGKCLYSFSARTVINAYWNPSENGRAKVRIPPEERQPFELELTPM
jgi:hypothetical protein